MNQENLVAVSTSRREQKLGELCYLMGLFLAAAAVLLGL